MPRTLKKPIDSGDVESVRQHVHSNPELATTLIPWGPLFRRCRSEPLHYLSDAPFNQLWNHGRQEEIARILLSAGAPPNGLPKAGETPLHGAASLGECGVARALIEAGAELESQASYPGIPDGTPLDFAVHFGMVEVIDLLIAHGARVSSARMAAGAGLLEPLSQMLPNGDLIDVYRCACVCDRIEVVEFLANEGLDLKCHIEGASALHWAAWEAKPRMVRFLIEQGLPLDQKDSTHRMTPSEWAAHRRKQLGPRWGHDDVLETLAVSQTELNS